MISIKKMIDFYVAKSIKFYFQHSPLELRYAQVSYSQFGEDIFIDNYINKKNGFYVDIGAYHPFCFSNTYLFYKKGWSGINVEPNPYGFNLLKKWRKRDCNIQLAISNENKELDFMSNTTYSHIIDTKKTQDNDKIQDGKIITVKAKRLEDILNEYLLPQQGIDFMSIDCEGYDLVVLNSNNWKTYRPNLVLVEDHSLESHSEINEYLQKQDYRFICKLGLTKIFVNNHINI